MKRRMTSTEIKAACDAFTASTVTNDPTYKRRRTMMVDLRKDPWPAVSVERQIRALMINTFGR